MRIIDAKTGVEIPISEARQDYAITQAFAEQRHNSIGECLRRGEAVAA